MRTPLLLLSALILGCRTKDDTVDTGAIDGDPGTAVDADADGYDADEDCDDANSVVNPGAEEICDGIDNNCDGTADEGVTSTYYADIDGDGFGDESATLEACELPAGYVATANDCDDTDAENHPGAPERCDGVDNDCDGDIDEDVLTTWYADGDGDGYGDAGSVLESCDPEQGYVEDATDCDDTDATSFPGGEEVCDEADNDCDGSTDEGVTTTFYEDVDGDGYGVADTTTESCDLPTGYAAEAGDCDDAEPAVSPAADEVCDRIDNDCDGTIDEDDALDASTFYADDDGDGYGDAADTTAACEQPSGTVTDSTDCDDTDADINPGAEEVCDSADNDCDGTIDEDDASDAATWYADADGDGYGDADTTDIACDQPSGYLEDATDCDDTDADINPGAEEVCNAADDDCDGTTDEDDASDVLTWFEDADSDGYGDADSTDIACDQPSGFVSDDTDCDDNESAANPGETEVCDEIDNDCDGSTDEGVTTTLYADDDGDGYGDADSTTDACEEGGGYVADSTDCDDTDADINPGESEVWYDGIDSDCDGASDYDADEDGDDALDYGGGDCDDTDPDRYEGTDCRPESDCTHPSTTTLASYDPSGVSDILFNDECHALVSTIISGTDYVYTIESDGTRSYVSGYATHNIQSIALDPVTGDLMVSHNNNSAAGIGYSSGGSTITNLVSSTYNNGSLWSNTYMNRSSGSLAWDSSGCVWAPGFGGSGTLTCVETDGTTTEIISSGSHIESVALDSDEDLYIAIGDTVYLTDTSTGATTSYFTAGDDILDMVFDYNDDLYVENNSGEVELVPGDGTAASVYDTVSGQGRLAISPDGYLVRVIPAPVSAATYEEWELGD